MQQASLDGQNKGSSLIGAPSQWDSLCGLEPAIAIQKLSQFEEHALNEWAIGSPRIDLLLTLTRFNVFRALFDNTSSLGFTLDWLQEDAISPFYGSSVDSQLKSSSVPVQLRPTELQQHVEHHPWIDLFPFPQMRDNILREGEDFDDSPLCHSLIDNQECLGERSGLIVWGDPWNPSSWEATAEFLEKWPWVIAGCWSLCKSTNHWRTQRGEKNLFSDTLCSPGAIDADPTIQLLGC
jgi:hypothetical protein